MKALVGAWDHRPYQLLAEITALRTRVSELEHAQERVAALERALQEAQDEIAALRAIAAERDDAEVVLSSV